MSGEVANPLSRAKRGAYNGASAEPDGCAACPVQARRRTPRAAEAAIRGAARSALHRITASKAAHENHFVIYHKNKLSTGRLRNKECPNKLFRI